MFAYEKHFGQKRLTGDDYITHPLNVAWILTDICADGKAISAALLHDTIEDSDSTFDEIKSLFGEDVAIIVDGVTKINKINFNSDSEQMAANQRKILVGLSADVRVIIVKLADRLHNMRTLYVLSEAKQKRKAKETLEILTPVAHRLGMYKIKSELEDLSLRYSNPTAYFDIVEKLNDFLLDIFPTVLLLIGLSNGIISTTNLFPVFDGLFSLLKRKPLFFSLLFLFSIFLTELTLKLLSEFCILIFCF